MNPIHAEAMALALTDVLHASEPQGRNALALGPAELASWMAQAPLQWPLRLADALVPLPAGLDATQVVCSAAQLAALRRLSSEVLDPCAVVRDTWRGRALAEVDPTWQVRAARLDAAIQGLRNSLTVLRELPLWLGDEAAARDTVWRLVQATQVRLSPSPAGATASGHALAESATALLHLVAALHPDDTQQAAWPAVSAASVAAAHACQHLAWRPGHEGLGGRMWAHSLALEAAVSAVGLWPMR